MRNKILKIETFNFYEKKAALKKLAQAYTFGKNSDSSGGFKFEGPTGTNF